MTANAPPPLHSCQPSRRQANLPSHDTADDPRMLFAYRSRIREQTLDRARERVRDYRRATGREASVGSASPLEEDGAAGGGAKAARRMADALRSSAALTPSPASPAPSSSEPSEVQASSQPILSASTQAGPSVITSRTPFEQKTGSRRPKPWRSQPTTPSKYQSPAEPARPSEHHPRGMSQPQAQTQQTTPQPQPTPSSQPKPQTQSRHPPSSRMGPFFHQLPVFRRRRYTKLRQLTFRCRQPSRHLVFHRYAFSPPMISATLPEVTPSTICPSAANRPSSSKSTSCR